MDIYITVMILECVERNVSSSSCQYSKMYIYIYIYICVCVCVCIYIYIFFAVDVAVRCSAILPP